MASLSEIAFSSSLEALIVYRKLYFLYRSLSLFLGCCCVLYAYTHISYDCHLLVMVVCAVSGVMLH